ncbi:MAG: hypothetical protein MUE81_18715, partial [Thermoflexibacter sp.]|nr:hypothetical protein [Thermoflexibacter sp.]
MLPPNFDNLSNEQFALMIEAAMIGYVFSVDKLAIAVEKEKPLIHEVLASLSDFVIYLDDTYKDYCFIDEHTFLTFKSFDSPTQTSNLLQKVTYYYQNKNKYLENKFASLLSQIEHHTHNLTEIIKNPYIQEGNLPNSLMMITETLSRVIDISRVSVWKYRKDGDYIECLDLYEKLYNKHSKGVMLYKKDFPAYFSALETETTINA